MKTTHNFKNSWFFTAIAVAILLGEIVAWQISAHFGIRNNPVVVAVLSVGFVAAVVSVLYDGIDIG